MENPLVSMNNLLEFLKNDKKLDEEQIRNDITFVTLPKVKIFKMYR